MGLPDSNTDSLHFADRQRGFADPLDKILQVVDVSISDDASNEIIQLAIIDDSLRAVRSRRARDPDREIDLDGLRDLGFVRQHANARVERHRL